MISSLPFALLLASTLVTAPPSPGAVVTTRTLGGETNVLQTVRSEPGSTTLQVRTPDGRTVETTASAEKRVLIQLSARATLDRHAPGSAVEASLQRRQLALDLASLDARMRPRTPSRITREYETLFSGVAATVDAALVREIGRLPNVVEVFDDGRVAAQLTESVPLIGATAVATAYGVTGAGVKVAVIDTGIDYTHPDLGGCFGDGCRVVGGYDFVNHDSDPRDDHGHGTHVAGIIGANGTLKGVAPGVTLLAYKVLDSWGYGYDSDIMSALEYSLWSGARVANLSLGGPGDPGSPVCQTLDNASAAGMLSVVAAGNSGPYYRTIGSPGAALSALTVGATDKSWQLASFSSRGYVGSGAQLLMKPDLLAPGVSIRSTVPATGQLGDPSRYKYLDGTSMAAPHVAGSAALLLQWKPTQTPSDVKRRLVSSARSIGLDAFSEGAGRIDLVGAFGARAVPTPNSISFGVVDATSGVVVREQNLSLLNTMATAETLSLAMASPLPAGATLEIVPSSLTLQPGQSTNVLLRLRVDLAILPAPPATLSWSTGIAITGGGPPVSVPAYFFRGSMLTLELGEPPLSVLLVSPSEGQSFSGFGTRTSMSVLLASGTWDLLVHYYGPIASVAREQIGITASQTLNISRSEATRTITLRAVDEAEQPLDPWQFSISLFLGAPDAAMPEAMHFSSMLFTAEDEIRLSPMSPRMLVGLITEGSDPTGVRFFSSQWAGKGFSTNLTLPVTGIPFRRLTQSATPTPGAGSANTETLSGFSFRTTWGAAAIMGVRNYPPILNRVLYMQKSNSETVPFLTLLQTAAWESDGTNQFRWMTGPHMQLRNTGEIALEPLPWFNLFDPTRPPHTLLPAATGRWDLDTAPSSLPLSFYNGGTSIRAGGDADSPGWLSQTVTRIERDRNFVPSYDLYRSGSLIGTYPLSQLYQGHTSPAGPHELRATAPYRIGTVAGSTQVVATFDTSEPVQPSPPMVSRFRIEQNGLRTATPIHASPFPTAKFRVTDYSGPSTVSLAWRQNGTSTWTNLALTVSGTDYSGSDYSAALQQQGSIDLRVTAVNAYGQKLVEEWTPAMITVSATPPSVPASMTATRAGTSSISLSWAPSAGQTSIFSYRIERRPGNQTLESLGSGTTFTDNGVVAGNAYSYRVSAVDQNGLVSTPSAYDLATLIKFSDDPVLPLVTRIRGLHMAELRRAIDAIRFAAGLAPAWASYAAPTGAVVTASDFVSLRDRLNEARSIFQLPAVQFSQPVAPGTPVRGAELQSLRGAAQ